MIDNYAGRLHYGVIYADIGLEQAEATPEKFEDESMRRMAPHREFFSG